MTFDIRSPAYNPATSTRYGTDTTSIYQINMFTGAATKITGAGTGSGGSALPGTGSGTASGSTVATGSSAVIGRINPLIGGTGLVTLDRAFVPTMNDGSEVRLTEMAFALAASDESSVRNPAAIDIRKWSKNSL